MSDVEQIFWVLAALYVLASACWVRPGTVVLAAAFGRPRRPRTVARAALVQNDAGGLVTGSLLPCGTVAYGQAWPLSLSPAGVASAVLAVPAPDPRPVQEARYVAFADVKMVEAEG